MNELESTALALCDGALARSPLSAWGSRVRMHADANCNNCGLCGSCVRESGLQSARAGAHRVCNECLMTTCSARDRTSEPITWNRSSKNLDIRPHDPVGENSIAADSFKSKTAKDTRVTYQAGVSTAFCRARISRNQISHEQLQAQNIACLLYTSPSPRD